MSKFKLNVAVLNSKRFKQQCLIVGAILSAIFIFYLFLKLLPYPELDKFRQRQYSTRFFDRNGTLLQILPLKEGLRREWYDLEKIPTELKKIFIIGEDKNFYSHFGIDIGAIIRATWQNITTNRTVSGASTITMQLSEIITLWNKEKQVDDSKKSLSPIIVKLKEIFNAMHLEAKLSKNEILEYYLNSIPFGFQTEGVGSAARNFFNVTPDTLNKAQMLSLAIIPRRPALYNPAKNPMAAWENSITIGKKADIIITKDEWTSMVKAEKKFSYPMLAPHFTRWIVSLYIKESKIVPEELYLSVDLNLNQLIENSLSSLTDEYEYARISNGAAFVINNLTGEIIAWVGNGDFNDPRGGQIDGVLVKNQPGSSMKPFLFALALEKGFTPNTVFPDIPMDFGSANIYVPLNFNNRYNGPLIFRTALASSLNIPAVYLLYRIGIDAYMEKLSEIGFTSLEDERGSTGLSLALGSGEVSLYELVKGFSVFPRGGYTIDPIWLLDKYTTTTNNDKETKQVFESDIAAIICDILGDKTARVLGFAYAKVFDTPYPSIFKTGTSNQFQDIIALGATTSFTAGVWMGSFSGETVVGETGSSIPATVVREILDYLEVEKNYPAEDFNKPLYYKKIEMCTISGLAPSSFCYTVIDEFVFKNRVLEICNWHSDGEIRYPELYQYWARERNIAGSSTRFNNNMMQLQFISPPDGAQYIYDFSVLPSAQNLRIDVIGGIEDEAELFINKISAGIKQTPFFWYIPITQGINLLTVVCGNEKEEISITVK